MTRFLATAHRAFFGPHNDQLRACRRFQVLHLMHRIDDASRFQSISSKFHHQLKDQAISISPPEYSHLGKDIAAMEINGKHFMAINGPIPLDLKTVSTLKEVLDDAWYSLSAEQQAMMSKTALAERILRSAARGERDRERLLAAALVIAAQTDGSTTKPLLSRVHSGLI